MGDDARDVLFGIHSGEYDHPPGRGVDIEYPNGFRSRVELDDELFFRFERFLHCLDLSEDDRPGTLRRGIG